ncbi:MULTISPECIES: allantoinase AllB [unclassified Paenibacillus]|uniref:allantoinase AllB n=1 Tax=unclassified Paenibacillus TaxID=185978 RepID=UPI001AE4FFED|nr:MULTISPECIES: allantoinase AllB [unclassified Paenibacillus]MBP1154170.1 allantoinase [Paenibacillus sp. PvP091]MBP1170445.1 allantoinase [Paenibacillus sp. PvR098]MBP2441473.1 allantoinase [Paenibacillus sp. PvP052]
MAVEFDVVIKGGHIVRYDKLERMDIGIARGVITCIQETITASARKEIDARGEVTVPGMIDVHVHLNEPGLGDWEGIPSGSAALAAGGCTTYFDMPLNCLPPTTTVPALNDKLELAKQRSCIDYAFWGGLVTGNVEQLAPLAEAGVIGYKAFLSAAGGKQEGAFLEVDDQTLYQGMREIARLGKILALHAESEPIVSALAAEKQSKGLTSAKDYLHSRPIYAEFEAVRRVLYYAELTGCALHFVHISSPAAVLEIRTAKRAGLNVTLETCPHYLMLTGDALEEIGALAKCAPPLRTNEELEGLWEAVRQGDIDMMSSDHSPCPPELKVSDNWFEIWGGISGAQSSLELFLGEGYARRNIPLPILCRMLSTHPARRFGLHGQKGEIALGKDADVAIIDFSKPYVLRKEHLYDRHKHNPYVGKQMDCRVKHTLVRGQIVYDWQCGITNPSYGQWLRS